ncbi:MAG: hypothetical protein JW744_00890 [Candidatus Diapherotrites archaeon]|uniref:Uncharacterized protein n=1 Tax=Candidatus Iainarchaeum sp. TaxID=3101447 RepID=A0A938YTR9_9ARCH|nr:hypothetical protein [Candidatus Diapherotrites archaeon]
MGDTSKPRHLNAREIEVLAKARQIGKRENLSRVEQQTLEEADRIRISQTMGEKVKKARREIKDYVVVSRHPIPVKIANLRADLKKTNHPEVKVALENAIAELENFGKTTRK